jgi:hypothetical protein
MLKFFNVPNTSPHPEHHSLTVSGAANPAARRLVARMPDSAKKAEAFAAIDCAREAAEVGGLWGQGALAPPDAGPGACRAQVRRALLRALVGAQCDLLGWSVRELSPSDAHGASLRRRKERVSAFTTHAVHRSATAQVAARIKDSDLLSRIQAAVAPGSAAGLAIAQVRDRFASVLR